MGAVDLNTIRASLLGDHRSKNEFLHEGFHFFRRQRPRLFANDVTGDVGSGYRLLAAYQTARGLVARMMELDEELVSYAWTVSTSLLIWPTT